MNTFAFAFAVAVTICGLLESTTAQQNYTIVPNSVPFDTRSAWCQNQETQCPLICLQTSAHSDVTKSNTCNPSTLTYSCICSNGLSPNVSQYSQTLPYYICTEWGTQCVSRCGTDNTCAANCVQNHPCGAQNPKRVKTSMVSATKTTTHGGVYTGFAGSKPSGSGAPGSGAGSLRSEFMGTKAYWLTLPVVVLGLLSGFGMML